MAAEPARPGPHDGSRTLFTILGSVVIALILYIIKLWIAPAAAPDNVLVFVIGGAIVGAALALLRRRRA